MIRMAQRGAARPVWMERPTGVGRGARAVVLTVVVLVVLFPFLTVLSTSLSSEQELTAHGGFVLFPIHPTLAAYQAIMAGGIVTRAVTVSFGITTVGTLLSLACTAAMAYALSRPVIGRRPVLLMVLFTFLFAPGIIPVYLVVRQLGMLNTYQSLIIPTLVNAFNLVVLRSFFMGVPRDLVDSATMDGASELSILTRIMLPLSKGVLAVIGLFYAVAYWNAFFNAILYLNDTAKWPLQLVLRLYVLQGQPMPGTADVVQGTEMPAPQAIEMAVVVIAVVPILLAYPFLQRYFTKGVLTGAIKG
jgi:putative aldouronate transport system permease protein